MPRPCKCILLIILVNQTEIFKKYYVHTRLFSGTRHTHIRNQASVS